MKWHPQKGYIPLTTGKRSGWANGGGNAVGGTLGSNSAVRHNGARLLPLPISDLGMLSSVPLPPRNAGKRCARGANACFDDALRLACRVPALRPGSSATLACRSHGAPGPLWRRSRHARAPLAPCSAAARATRQHRSDAACTHTPHWRHLFLQSRVSLARVARAPLVRQLLWSRSRDSRALRGACARPRRRGAPEEGQELGRLAVRGGGLAHVERGELRLLAAAIGCYEPLGAS